MQETQRMLENSRLAQSINDSRTSSLFKSLDTSFQKSKRLERAVSKHLET